MSFVSIPSSIFSAVTTSSTTNAIPDSNTLEPSFPSLPSVSELLKSFSFETPEGRGPFDQFIAKKRIFLGKITEEHQRNILTRLQNDLNYEEFKNEPILQESEFEFETTYQDVINSVTEKYRSLSKLDGIYLRGGFLRDLLYPWLRECLYILQPNAMMRKREETLPPDFDILFNASDLTLERIHDIDTQIFRHIAKKLSAHKPHLEEAYFVLASICCYSKRITLFAGGEYTLTTLRCKNSPDLEIIISKSMKRNYLCRLDNLRLGFYERILECNDGDRSEQSIWKMVVDNIFYYLTIDNPETVDGLGFARIISHTVCGGIIQGADTLQRLYYGNSKKLIELENESLCKKLKKCCDNHLKSNKFALAAMFWNTYVFTGCSIEIFAQHAHQFRELGFQREDIETWILNEIEKVHSSTTFEMVEQCGARWWRIHERGIYWFMPMFPIEDNRLVQLVSRARHRVPREVLATNFANVNFSSTSLPVALVQTAQVRWHRHAVTVFDELPSEERKRSVANSMFESAHQSAIDILLTIYRRMGPDTKLFFSLVNRVMAIKSFNMSQIAGQLCELSLQLPHLTRYSVHKNAPGVRWLIGEADDPYQIYTNLASLGYIAEAPSELLDRYSFSGLSTSDLLDHPVFALLPENGQLGHLRRALLQAPSDLDFQRCFKKGWINIKEARVLFAELAHRFLYVNCDWVLELYKLMPLEVFQTIPFGAARALSFKMEVTAAHVNNLVTRFKGTPLELHELLFFHIGLFDPHAFGIEKLIALALQLIELRKYQEALVWIKILLENKAQLTVQARTSMFHCCFLGQAFAQAADLALTVPNASPVLVNELFEQKDLSLTRKLALAEKFGITGLARWKGLVSSYPPSDRIVKVIQKARERGDISKIEGEVLLFDELFLLLSETDSDHFVTCLFLMLSFLDRLTKEHLKGLLKLVPRYLKTIDRTDDPTIFFYWGLIKSDRTLAGEFLLLLASEEQNLIVNAIALHFALKLLNDSSYTPVLVEIVKKIPKWKEQRAYEVQILALASSFIVPGLSLSDLLTQLEIVIPIKTPTFLVFCGRILKGLPVVEAEAVRTSSLMLAWLNNCLDVNETEQITDENFVDVDDLVAKIRDNFSNVPAFQADVARVLGRFIVSRIQLAGEDKIDMATVGLIFCFGDQVVKNRQFLDDKALMDELMPIFNSIIEALLRHKDYYKQFEKVFNDVWIFFREEPATASSKKRNDAKRIVEVGRKAAILQSCIRALPGQLTNYTHLLSRIKNLILLLYNDFPELDAHITPIFHAFVFSDHPPTLPVMFELKRSVADKMLVDLNGRKNSYRHCLELVTEICIYLGRMLGRFLPVDKEVQVGMQLIRRVAARGTPYWICEATILCEIKEIQMNRDLYCLQEEVFTIAANSLEHISLEQPHLRPPYLYLSVILSQFSKSKLYVDCAPDLRREGRESLSKSNLLPLALQKKGKGTAMRLGVIKLLLDGAIKYVRRFAKHATYEESFVEVHTYIFNMMLTLEFCHFIPLSSYYLEEMHKISNEFPLSEANMESPLVERKAILDIVERQRKIEARENDDE